MRIAFHSPLKPPDHPVASGDRAMARGLVAALELAGHDVALATHFRSYDSGDARRQQRLRQEGRKLAHRFIRAVERGAPRPDVWFTYHLYHKAPDWIGPEVSRRLGIPYVVAEASFAPKQAGGRWDLGHRAVAEALGQASLVLSLNPADAECVLPLLAGPARLQPLAPFIDTAPFRGIDREAARAALATELSLNPAQPWLLAVGMMRNDQKLLSYRVLAQAAAQLADVPWQLVLAGAGDAEGAVMEAFAPVADRVRRVGIIPLERLAAIYSGADLYVWPAMKEAYGISFLEAQAAGLPVVAGASGGVPAIVADCVTGLLTPEGDAAAFADAVRALLGDPLRRRAMGTAAAERTAREHDIDAAAQRLNALLAALAA